MNDILLEIMDDWCKIKNPKKLTVMKSHIQFFHKFFINTFIVYNLTTFTFSAFALQSYFSQSVENRVLPILVKFPFSTQNSPNYEILYTIQAILLIIIANVYTVSDSSYAAMVNFRLDSKIKIVNI